MARAAQGASPAFFKLIRTGGCSSREQLASQFSYLFSKSVDIHDSKGLLDHSKTLTPEQIDRAVARWADDWKGKMNAARTTHMVMSFPRGANPRHVSLIAGEICREKLGGRFDYMIAVHTDSPNKNPHAHIIVNRRGGQGDYFALRRGTEYTYETFKDAMVDHAKRYGIQLEATTRLQRGHVNYPPTDGQWRRAKEKAADNGQAFEAPAGKPRVGAALARATDEIRDWSLRYRDLSSFAFRARGKKHRNAVLTLALARSLKYGGRSATFARVEAETKASIRAIWTPTAENFFSRVSAAYLDALMIELTGTDPAGTTFKAFRDQKKAAKAQSLERLFSDADYQAVWQIDADHKAKIAAWLPHCF